MDDALGVEIVKGFEDLSDVKGRQSLWKVAKLFNDIADRSILNKLDDDVQLIVDHDRVKITDDVAMIHLFEHLQLLLFVSIGSDRDRDRIVVIIKIEIEIEIRSLSEREERLERVSNGKSADFLIVLDDEFLDGDKLARLGIQTLEHDALFSLSKDTTKELSHTRSRRLQRRQCRAATTTVLL